METQTLDVADFSVVTNGAVVDAIDVDDDKALELEVKRTLAGYKATVSRLESKGDKLSEQTKEAAKAAIAKLVGAFPHLNGTVGSSRKASADKSDEQRALLSIRAIRATITRKAKADANDPDLVDLRRREDALMKKYPGMGTTAVKTGDAKVDMLVMRAAMRALAVANRAAIDAALQAALSQPVAAAGEPLVIEGTAEVVEPEVAPEPTVPVANVEAELAADEAFHKREAAKAKPTKRVNRN